MKHTKFKTNKFTYSSLDQTKPKAKRLQKRVSCGMVLMASTMLHEKCCNTVLQIEAPREPGRDGKILSDHRQDGNDEVHRL